MFSALRPFRMLLVVLVLVVAGAFVGRAIGQLEKALPVLALQEPEAVDGCITRLAGPSGDKTVWALSSFSEFCATKGASQASLNDFQIRRMKFFGQYYAESVTLWIVVFVTVAGVILSGLQIATGFHLAMSAKPDAAGGINELTLEAGKISLRSSAIGLMVLFTSLAFFIIYVFGIYTVREVSDGKEVKAQQQAQTQAVAAQPVARQAGGITTRPAATKP